MGGKEEQSQNITDTPDFKLPNAKIMEITIKWQKIHIQTKSNRKDITVTNHIAKTNQSQHKRQENAARKTMSSINDSENNLRCMQKE